MPENDKNNQDDKKSKLEVSNLDTLSSDNDKKILIDKNPKFNIGDIVRHRIYPFRGVIVDVDPEFSNTEDWYNSIPAEIRPSKDQPYYHLMAENTETFYSAYVSQQNLIFDSDNGPVDHPDLEQIFNGIHEGKYRLKSLVKH